MPSRHIEVVIRNQLGMHSRPASIFVKSASGFKSSILVEKEDGGAVNGKSILALLMLAAGFGTRLRISANGDDADIAVKTLADLVERDPEFNEE